jgi:sugar phosphate permease
MRLRCSVISSHYRWAVLTLGVLAQAALASLHQGLPSIGPALQDLFGVGLIQTGAFFSAVTVGITLTLASWGLLADRIGERAVLAGGLVGAAVALAGAALVQDYAPAFVALVVAGMLGGCANAASGRAVMGWFAKRERGLALGVRQMASPLGGGLAALALPFAVSRAGVPAAFWVLAAFCGIVGLACGVGLRRSPVSTRPASGGVQRLLRDARLWRLASSGGLIVSGQACLVSYLVLFLSGARGLGLAAAAAVLVACQLAGALVRVVVGVWSDRLGERIRPMRWLAFTGATMLAVTTLLVDAPIGLLVPVALITTVVTMSTNGLAFTATGEIASAERAGAAMGLQTTLLFISGAVATVVFGAIAAGLGWRAGFSFLAITALGGSLLLSPLTRLERLGWTAEPA